MADAYPAPFEIGSMVTLRSPSSAMTVIAIGDEPDTYLCAWFNDDRNLQQHLFPGAALRKWEDRRGQ